MAYSRANLQRVGPQNNGAPTLWTFSDTGSTLVTIDGAGYFSDASDIVKVGDFIFAVGSNGYGIFVVNYNTSGTVDVTNATAVGTIDSD